MDDPRLTPARAEVAAKYLEGKVKAARFVEGESFEVAEAIAPLRQQPAPDAELMTQALKGDRATIYDRNGEGWAWGQLGSDGYVGWLPESTLARPAAPATHRVTALSTFAFPGPSIKLPPVAALPMGAMVAIVRDEGTFAVTAEGCFLPRQHVGPLDSMMPDFVAVAERFVGTPYLVQVSLNAAGTGCPRDSDMQQAGLGRALSPAEMTKLQRGDLIFWKGHVAIVRAADTIVHANAHHMATVVENTRDAIARIKAAGREVTAIKRL